MQAFFLLELSLCRSAPHMQETQSKRRESQIVVGGTSSLFDAVTEITFEVYQEY